MKKLFAIVLSLALLLGVATAFADAEALRPAFASISTGDIMGYYDNGAYNFLGIPYGTAARFQQPVAAEAWEGTLNCLTLGEVCPQGSTKANASVNVHEFMTPAGNDMVSNEASCLNLNVWTSDLEGEKPVVVFMHGGGLASGSSHELVYYDGGYIAKYDDVVFVSVNMRLNYLGFLDVSAYGGEEYANSANCGLADMVLALEWVQENIAAFGGNPEDVTLLGQSGGGSKVTSLASLPTCDGLFKNVFVMSGGYSNPSDTTQETAKLVEYLGIGDGEVIDALTSMSYEELSNACSAAKVRATPSIGNEYYPKAFIEDGVVNEYAAQYNYIWGSAYAEMRSNGEGLTAGTTLDITNVYKPDMTEEQIDQLLTERFGDSKDAIVEAFLAAYPDHDAVDVLWMNSRNLSAGNGFDGVATLAANGLTVYNYVVSYEFPYFGGVQMHHSGDIGFWFHSIETIPYQIAGDEEMAMQVSGQMAAALAAFAANGDPSTEELAWPAYTEDSHMTMVFDRTSGAAADFDAELLSLIAASQG